MWHKNLLILIFVIPSCAYQKTSNSSILTGKPKSRLETETFPPARWISQAEQGALSQRLAVEGHQNLTAQKSQEQNRKSLQEIILKLITDYNGINHKQLFDTLGQFLQSECAGLLCRQRIGLRTEGTEDFLSQTASMVAYSEKWTKPDVRPTLITWLSSLAGVGSKSPDKACCSKSNMGLLDVRPANFVLKEKIASRTEIDGESGIYLGADGVVRGVIFTSSFEVLVEQAIMDFLERQMTQHCHRPITFKIGNKIGYAFSIPPLGAFTPKSELQLRLTFKAYIFISRNVVPFNLPIMGSFNAGHIGWGLEFAPTLDGEKRYIAGTIENPSGSPMSHASLKGTVRDTFASEQELLNRFRKTTSSHGEPEYTSFRTITCKCTQTEMLVRLERAIAVAEENAKRPYFFLGENCLDDTYRVLKAAGFVNGPHPCWKMTPNNWFDSIKTPSEDILQGRESPLHPEKRILEQN